MRNIWFHEVEPEVQLLSFSFYGAAQSLVKDTHFLPNQTLLSVMLGGCVCVCLCVHVCVLDGRGDGKKDFGRVDKVIKCTFSSQ